MNQVNQKDFINSRSAGIAFIRWNNKNKVWESLMGISESGTEFLGGKKEDSLNETTEQTAFREFFEETGKLLPDYWKSQFMRLCYKRYRDGSYTKGFNKVYIKEGKYTLYVINLSIFERELRNDIDYLPRKYYQMYNGVIDYSVGREMKSLMWISFDNLVKNSKRNRNFANIILKNYISELIKFSQMPIYYNSVKLFQENEHKIIKNKPNLKT